MKETIKGKPVYLGILLAISAASFFALSLTTASYSYDYGTNPQTIMLIRFSCMTLIMLLWNKLTSTALYLPKKTIIKCSLLSLFYYIGIGAYLASVAYMPASLSVFILYTFPILVILLNSLLEKRRPNLLIIGALVIAFIGLFIALDVNFGDFSNNTRGIQGIGIILAISAALGVTMNMVGSAKLLEKTPFTLFSYYQAMMITVLSVVIVVFSGGLALPKGSMGWIAFMTMLVCFIIAYISVYSALKMIGAVRTSTIMNLEPIMTTIFAIMLLDEVITTQKVMGGLIVLVAILLAQWPQIRLILCNDKK